MIFYGDGGGDDDKNDDNIDDDDVDSLIVKLPPCLLIDQVDPDRVLFWIQVIKGVIFIPANKFCN